MGASAVVKTIAQLEREFARAETASLKASEARSRLPAGSSRARVTTANARWARKAEERDRILGELAAARLKSMGAK